MNPGPWRIHDQFHAMCDRYVGSGFEQFAWKGADADADWEPHFGFRMF